MDLQGDFPSGEPLYIFNDQGDHLLLPGPFRLQKKLTLFAYLSCVFFCPFEVALVVNNDFPMNCPTGPHFKTFDSGWIEHPLNIHNQNFGHGWNEYPTDQPKSFYSEGWRYWSRPCPSWNISDKTVKYYLAHVKNIMMSV